MEQKTKKVKYKVREMSTGLYWSGKVQTFTGEPRFTERGKVWDSVEKLQEFFGVLEKLRITISPLWEVIEYTTSPAKGECYPAIVFASKKKIL